MSERAISVWLGPEIIYVYGTVNGEPATFTLAAPKLWEAVVPRTPNDIYEVHLECYSENGLEYTKELTLYYGWMACITDRTLQDVIRGTSKGFYNAEDLNRVGRNVKYLVGVLHECGYDVPANPKEDWDETDIPKASEMESYLADLEALKAGFYGSIPLPDSMNDLTLDGANNIEKLLMEINELINRMKAGYRKCGTVKSGQGVILT